MPNDDTKYNENGFSQSDNGGIVSAQRGSTDPIDIGPLDWKQIEACVLGTSAGGVTGTPSSPESVWAAAKAFSAAQNVLTVVADSLSAQAEAIAGGDNPPWQGKAAKTFLKMMQGFAQSVQVNADRLGGGPSGEHSVPMQLAVEGNRLSAAMATILAMDEFYANEAGKQVAAMNNGLIPVSQVAGLPVMIANSMRPVLGNLIDGYTLTVDSLAKSVPVETDTSGGGDDGDSGDDKNDLNGLGDDLKDGLKGFGDDLSNSFGDFGDSLGNSFGDFGDSLGNSLGGLGDSLGDSLGDFGGDLGNSLGGLGDLKTFDPGTDGIGDQTTIPPFPGVDGLGDGDFGAGLSGFGGLGALGTGGAGRGAGSAGIGGLKAFSGGVGDDLGKLGGAGLGTDEAGQDAIDDAALRDAGLADAGLDGAGGIRTESEGAAGSGMPMSGTPMGGAGGAGDNGRGGEPSDASGLIAPEDLPWREDQGEGLAGLDAEEFAGAAAGGAGLVGLDGPAGRDRAAGARPGHTAADGGQTGDTGTASVQVAAATDTGPADTGVDHERDDQDGLLLVPIPLPGGRRRERDRVRTSSGDAVAEPVGEVVAEPVAEQAHAVDSLGNAVQQPQADDDVEAWNREAGWRLSTTGRDDPDGSGDDDQGDGGGPPGQAPDGDGPDRTLTTWRPDPDAEPPPRSRPMLLGDDPNSQPESVQDEEADAGEPEGDISPGAPTRFAALLSQEAASWEGIGSVTPGVLE